MGCRCSGAIELFTQSIKKRKISAYINRINRSMTDPRITLEQWRALLAVVECRRLRPGRRGAAQEPVDAHLRGPEDRIAARREGRSRSRAARRCSPPAGQVLYRRARDAGRGGGARSSTAPRRWRGTGSRRSASRSRSLFPTWLLLQCLGKFADERPETRIELYESVLGGTDEALLGGAGRPRDRLAGAAGIPRRSADARSRDRRGRAPATTRCTSSAASSRTATCAATASSSIRDSGTQRTRARRLAGAEQRWTVSHKATSIRAASMGLGFAWYPEDTIRGELDAGALKPLPLREGAERWAELYLDLRRPGLCWPR